MKNFDFDKYKSENIFSQVVENDVTWERFEPRAKIQENKIYKILNFEFFLSFKSVPG